MSQTSEVTPAPTGLRRLGVLRTQNGSFDPQCLTPLVRLLEPRALVRSHVVHWHARAVGVRKTAWLLEGEGEEGWMIKEISCKRRCCNIPTALENCDSLIQKFPNLLLDETLAFPHSCVELQTPSGEHTNDLLISRRCPGVQLCRFFSDLDLRLVENQEHLERVAAKVGELLADFHARYSDPLTGEATYHTDFHPSNVLYEPQSDTLTFIDLDGMGSSGISDDVEKFERLLWTFSAERYASAFRLKYMALAKPLAKPQRSSTKSTAASSEDLYPPTATVVTRRLPRGESFKCPSSLAIPSSSGFNPRGNLVTLAWLISPSEKMTEPRVRTAKKKAWMLYQNGQKECWYLQQVASNVDASLLEKRCRAFVRIFPHVLADECLAFPHSMIPLQMGSKNCGHLLVANGPCNTTLEQYFLECQDNRDKVLEELLPRVGEKLAKTLDKYRSNELIQLKPSGVLYDAQREIITFADFAWGDEGSDGMNVLDRLCDSLKSFADDRHLQKLRMGFARVQRSRQRGAFQKACFGNRSPPHSDSEGSSSSSSDEETSGLCRTM